MQVFLSHATRDAELVHRVKSALEPRVSVYCAEFDKQPGTNVNERIMKAMRASDLVVVLLTGSAFSSDYVKQEIGFALGAKKPVIPVVAPGFESHDPAMLNGLEQVRMDESDPTAWLHTLAVHVGKFARQEGDQAMALGLVVVAAGLLLLLQG